MNYFAPLSPKVIHLYKYEYEPEGDVYCELEIPFTLEHPQDLIWWSILIFPSVSKVSGDQVCNYIMKYVKDIDEGTSYLNSLPEQRRRTTMANAESVCRALICEGINWGLPPMYADGALDSFKKTYDRGSKLTVKGFINLMIRWEEQEENLTDVNVLPSQMLAFLHTHVLDANFQTMMYRRPFLPDDFESYVRPEFQRRGIEKVDIKSLFFNRYNDMEVYAEDKYWDYFLRSSIPTNGGAGSPVSKRRFIKCTHCHKKGHYVNDCWFNQTGFTHGRGKPKAPKKENGRGRAYYRNKRIPT